MRTDDANALQNSQDQARVRLTMSPMSVYLDAALRANACFHPVTAPTYDGHASTSILYTGAPEAVFAACLYAGFAVARASDIEEWIRLAVVDLGGGPHLATLDEGDGYLRFEDRKSVV